MTHNALMRTPDPPRRIWLLSAYRAESHAAWADRLVRDHGAYRWRRFELPGRHFAWRIRGNPLSWFDELGAASESSPPDALIATSMVDLATIRGLHPALARVPTLLYFHENQFAYPRSERQVTSIEARMVQLYAALCADRVLFNSRFNRRSFLDGVAALLARMPDHVPGDLGSLLSRRSDVLPVPVEAIAPAPRRDPRLVVWNHRWEYDKAPDLFAEAMVELERRGVAFRLALLGPRGARPVPALARIRSALASRIEIDRCPDREDYRAVLARAGVVVSTARHEFQGLSVLEAVSAGCVPLVPDALCYREQYPESFRYAEGDSDALAGCLQGWFDAPRAMPRAPSVHDWTGPKVKARWSEELARLLASAGGLGRRAVE
ncbi:tRNA-queuosine alpha-mannosyltransferase domain-containing protein [Halomonas denitrificans]|nr:DUF3524 domain-containing protein [Halomonas denitrificans]